MTTGGHDPPLVRLAFVMLTAEIGSRIIISLLKANPTLLSGRLSREGSVFVLGKKIEGAMKTEYNFAQFERTNLW